MSALQKARLAVVEAALAWRVMDRRLTLMEVSETGFSDESHHRQFRRREASLDSLARALDEYDAALGAEDA
jgi:hypothetical protein